MFALVGMPMGRFTALRSASSTRRCAKGQLWVLSNQRRYRDRIDVGGQGARYQMAMSTSK